MTTQRELKQLVRERMARTGERYAAARAHVVARAAAPAPRYPGVLAGYDRFGGLQANTAPLFNVLRHTGIPAPAGAAAWSEAIVNGLCGGPGFLYAVFEYRGYPPMLTLALQSRSMADQYVAEGLGRVGVEWTTSETTSAKVARAALDDALAAGRAALGVVDLGSLPYYGLPKEYVGGAPHLVAVVGRDDTGYWLDDRGGAPRHLSFDQLATARARYRKSRHRLITAVGPAAGFEPAAAWRAAVADTARCYHEPAVPKSFWGNCGFAGLRKWRDLLTDRRDAKGWPNVFAEGPRAYAGLYRTYECIEAGLAPGAGRGLYAEFLEAAAAFLGAEALVGAAAWWRESAGHWSALAALIAGADDEALRAGCDLADRRIELGDAAGAGSVEAQALWRERHELGGRCRLGAGAAAALYEKMAERVGAIIAAEEAAVAAMSG